MMKPSQQDKINESCIPSVWHKIPINQLNPWRKDTLIRKWTCPSEVYYYGLAATFANPGVQFQELTRPSGIMPKYQLLFFWLGQFLKANKCLQTAQRTRQLQEIHDPARAMGEYDSMPFFLLKILGQDYPWNISKGRREMGGLWQSITSAWLIKQQLKAYTCRRSSCIRSCNGDHVPTDETLVVGRLQCQSVQSLQFDEMKIGAQRKFVSLFLIERNMRMYFLYFIFICTPYLQY